MNTTELLRKLKEQFSEVIKNADYPAVPEVPEVPEMVAPMKHKLKDGTEIEVTEMGVGGVVTIQGQPAPVGDHTLEDGTIISVRDNGVISAVTLADGTMPPMVEDMSTKFSAFETSTNEKFASYESKFANYEQRFADYETKLNRAVQVIDGLLSLTTQLSETPTGVPDVSVKPATNFSADKIEDKWKGYDTLFS